MTHDNSFSLYSTKRYMNNTNRMVMFDIFWWSCFTPVVSSVSQLNGCRSWILSLSASLIVWVEHRSVVIWFWPFSSLICMHSSVLWMETNLCFTKHLVH